MTTSVWIGKLLECPVTIQAEWEDQTGNIRREVFTQRASATMFLRNDRGLNIFPLVPPYQSISISTYGHLLIKILKLL